MAVFLTCVFLMSLPVNSLANSNREKLHQIETISSFGHAQPTCRTVIKHIICVLTLYYT